MKCLKRSSLKWLPVVGALVVVTNNLNFKGDIARRGIDRTQLFYNSKQNASIGFLNPHHISKEGLTSTIKNSSDGYNLAERLNKKCNTTMRAKKREKVFGSYEWRSVETCIIWKIGTTAIKRMYMMKRLPQYSHLINPYEIRFDKRYLPKGYISKNPSVTRFMFVRNPYNRLVSGYVDKLLAPNPVYWQIIGVPAIRATRQKPDKLSLSCGHDLEFHEYVNYVIKAMNPRHKGAKVDGHFDRMTSLCKPCSVNYNFIGKMESFTTDSLELLRHLNMSQETMKLIEEEGGKYAWMDALKDTAHQPFDTNFRKEYINCISFYEALKRSWKKMRIRGLIGRQDFPLKESEAKKLTESMFIQLAIKSREKSTSKERKQLQQEHFLKLFSTVTKSDLEMIRTIYAADFKLFEYNDRPDNLFRDNTI